MVDSSRPAAGSERRDPNAVATSAGAEIPFWLVRLGGLGWRVLVIVAFALVLLAIAVSISTVTASILVAFLASVAVAPLVTSLRARGWGSGRAAAVGTLLVVGIVVAILGVAVYVLVVYGPDLVRAIRDGVDALRDGEAGDLVPPAIADSIADMLDGSLEWFAGNVAAIVGNVASVATVLLFAAFTTFYVLQDFGRGWRWITQGMSDHHREAAAQSAGLGIQRVGGYLRRTAIMAALEALITLALLVVLGVAVAFPLSVLVFAGGFIPYIGAIVATAAVLLVAFASVGPTWTFVLLILIVVLNLVTERLVAPRLERVSARINPAIVLIALPIGASLGGLLGVILAVPVAVALLAIGTSAIDIVRPDGPDGAAASEVVPPWLDMLAQWSWRLLIGIALVAAALTAVLQIPILALPLIIAAVLAATFAPIVGWLTKRGWGLGLAAAVVTAGVTGIIGLLTVLSVVFLISNVGDLVAGLGDGAGAINDFLEGLGGSLEDLVATIGNSIATAVLSVTLSAAAVALVFLVGIILTYFFLRDGRDAWDRITSRTAPWRRRELDAAGGQAVSVLGGYMLGTGAVSLFGAATQWALMVILGVPLALPIFVLSFFGGYIPYIGSLITTGAAFLLAVTTGDPVAIIVMFAFTAIFNVVQGNVVQPLVFSRAVNIHPAIVLLSIPAGGALGGIIGMFLVVPFLGVVAATWRTVLVVLGQPPAPGAIAGAADAPAPADDARIGSRGGGGRRCRSGGCQHRPRAPFRSGSRRDGQVGRRPGRLRGGQDGRVGPPVLSSDPLSRREPSVGAWRSLVARIVRDDEVGGSNPLAPTRLDLLSRGRRRPVAIAAVVAGVANLAEDALGQSWGGVPYIVGSLVAWLSLIPLAIAIWPSPARRAALLPLALFGSIALFNAGGGLLIFVVAAAYAIAGRWFLRSSTVTS